jgi:hypothetical protein
MLALDHVVYVVRDLDEGAERWRRDFGLDTVDGGRHVGWGTANRIVPLGETYVELVAAVVPEEAEGSAFGRAVLGAEDGWLTSALASDDLDALAERLGLATAAGSRRRPDGEELRWRSAGFDDERRAWWMPFFIAWDVPVERHPGRARAGHGARVTGIASVEIAGDAERLRSWLGEAKLPFAVVDGPGQIRSVTLSTADGALSIPSPARDR